MAIVQISTSARQLYEILAARAEEGHVSFETCLRLAVELRDEYDPGDVLELQKLGWIKPTDSGGWEIVLFDLNRSPWTSRAAR